MPGAALSGRITLVAANLACVPAAPAPMLKKIQVSQLRLGMYIKEFCGSWMEHPFWRTAFLLEKPQDLADIQASGITEVWIDTSKGLDLREEAGAQTEAEAISLADEELKQAVAGKHLVQTVPLVEEMQRAAKLYAKSKKAVYSMFQEARMGKAVNAESARAMVEEITTSIRRNPGALISLARLKTADEYTYMHSVAVCALMIALARQLNLDDHDTREAGVAGLLHDLGKAKISPDILNKPGRLTDAEFRIVKTHPVIGHSMLMESYDVGETALDVCLHHHEKMDGSGYPFGFPPEKISLYARMGAVCDVYDAITSNRPYKAGWNPAESLHKMAQWADGHFDRRVFQAFVKSVGIYPIGSFVRLHSGRMGVVVEQGQASLLNPKVKVFFSSKSRTRMNPEIVDLSRPSAGDKIVAREDPLEWGIHNIAEMWSEGLVQSPAG
jgi:HD-GYP domain-containing protein (c-di-GMP phosphodiesterase class II)